MVVPTKGHRTGIAPQDAVKEEYHYEISDPVGTSLPGGKHAILFFTTAFGQHTPDEQRGNAYRGTRCTLLIMDRNNKQHQFTGDVEFSKEQCIALKELTKSHLLYADSIAGRRREGVRVSLGEALNKARVMFGLEDPAYISQSPTYKMTTRMWKNAKAKIWAAVLPKSRADQVIATIEKRDKVCVKVPAYVLAARRQARREQLQALFVAQITQHGPQNMFALGAGAIKQGWTFSDNPYDEIRKCLKKAKKVFYRTSDSKPYCYGLRPTAECATTTGRNTDTVE